MTKSPLVQVLNLIGCEDGTSFLTNQSKANERKIKAFPEYNRQSIENCSSVKLWSVALFLPISAALLPYL